MIGDRLNLANKSARIECGASWSALETIKARQIAHGAAALDVCAAGHVDEIRQMSRLLALDGPSRFRAALWSLDTLDPAVIEAVVPRLGAGCILNCFSGLNWDNGDMLTAIQRFEGSVEAVIVLCLDARGANAAAEQRVEIAIGAVRRLAELNIGPERIIFDALTMTVAAGLQALETTLATVRLIRQRYPHSGVLCASSNYSYGSQTRSALECAFAVQARQAGANVFLANALNARLCRVILG